MTWHTFSGKFKNCKAPEASMLVLLRYDSIFYCLMPKDLNMCDELINRYLSKCISAWFQLRSLCTFLFHFPNLGGLEKYQAVIVEQRICSHVHRLLCCSFRNLQEPKRIQTVKGSSHRTYDLQQPLLCFNLSLQLSTWNRRLPTLTKFCTSRMYK